jgi:GDP-mannose 6-dehydrogenase
LSRLLGANRRYIEDHLPHIGSLMDADIGSVITQADLVVVGLNERKVFDGLRSYLRDDQAVLDLVSIPDRATLKGRYIGMCW